MGAIPDEVGKELHDRATRGESLSPEALKQLEGWYQEQDRLEAAALGRATASEALALQVKLDSALARMTDTSRRIQEIAAENDALRHENAELQNQLARRRSAQPA